MNVDEALKYYYNYDSYRSNQRDIVLSLLNQNDTIAILPTGGGKSVCFQIPALLTEGVCIVITPLISLMNDQVYELNNLNVTAISINSTISNSELNNIYNNIEKYKFVYVSPERLENNEFLNYINKIKLSYIIIDEAHCIETWGSSFRTSYQRIYEFIKNRNITIGCFTATSTKYTLNKIISLLNLTKYNLFQTSLSRNNLLFEIIKTNNKLNLLKQMLLLPGVKIIYCSTVKSVEYLYNILNKEFNITMYHGRLNNRNINQDKFIKGKIDIIIATNAFGMGINKSNVRYVIHYEISSSIEDYYQEAGRAGRDNNSAKCILLFNNNDFKVHYYQRDLLLNEKTRNKKTLELYSLEKFVNTKTCLEVKMKEYFSEQSNPCFKCSNCLKNNPSIDISKILLDFDNIDLNYKITPNNKFLINEFYYKLTIKYKKYILFLKENKYKIKLIYDYKKHILLLELFKKINKIECVKLKKELIIKLIYLNPVNYNLITNESICNILNKYHIEITNILEKN